LMKAQLCPQCGSKLVVSNGNRYLSDGSTVQRYKCKECFHRFSNPTSLKTVSDNSTMTQVCVSMEKTKNLPPQADIKTVCAGDSNLVNYAWQQLKRGNQENTIKLRLSVLKRLQKKGGDLNNPETISTLLATEPLTKAQKYQWKACYQSYVKTMKLSWDPPRVKYEPKEPFMPTREELSALIHAAHKAFACFLQVALDTGARSGEICKLQWTDVNTERNTISINDAEKNSRNRTIRVPAATIAMIQALKRKYDPYIFNPNPDTARAKFCNLRNRLAIIHKNHRFRQIRLHTFRHWFATNRLRQTKQLTHVQYLLGHKSIVNTERYTHMANFDSMKYYSAVAKTEKERCQLIEDGWTFVERSEGISYYRKEKYD
jgi:integrase